MPILYGFPIVADSDGEIIGIDYGCGESWRFDEWRPTHSITIPRSEILPPTPKPPPPPVGILDQIIIEHYAHLAYKGEFV